MNKGDNGLPAFPSEITFKSIFYNKPHVSGSIQSALSESNVMAGVNRKESKNGKFISITITAQLPSREALDNLCMRISSIDGFLMMF